MLFDRNITVEQIERWLRENDPRKLSQLWDAADQIRQKYVGNEVHLRGLIEISNYCIRSCSYCGLRKPNKNLERYRMNAEEIFRCVKKAVDFGYGTVVIQAGEDYGIKAAWLGDVISKIKSKTSLAVTLSLGERPYKDIELWRQAGADRYLLRFETSNTQLYQLIHPAVQGQNYNRFDVLKWLAKLGYEVGSGVMVGIPGQSFESLAHDIDIFREYDMDMIGIGPYIVNRETPLGNHQIQSNIPGADQVPNTELMGYKVLALTRIVCPDANIPSTTALATINREKGRELGLKRGANVVMPNLTPAEYRNLYKIYPGKDCLNEVAEYYQELVTEKLRLLNRTVGVGKGCRNHIFSSYEKKNKPSIH